MKIVSIKATPVTVPLVKPVRWSFGVETTTTRVIVELTTDEGLVGIGETRGGDEVVNALKLHEDLVLGVDPFDVWKIARRFGIFRMTSEQLALVGAAKLAGAAVEMACWDLMGKALGKSCSDLWGGAQKASVEFAAYAFYRYDSPSHVGAGDRAEGIVDHAEELVETHGFRDVKLKNGVLHPDEELKSVEMTRERLAGRMRYLRLDPNGVWSVETSVRFLNAIEGYDIEFCEDPTWGLQGMSLVRDRVRVPLATNMALVNFEQFPIAAQVRGVDIVLGDVHFWGGPLAVLQLAKCCETFNMGMSMHSDRELGISTAAILHLAAAEPGISHSIDSHLPEQSDDVITEPFVFEGGRLTVPTGPGLGVELDPDKLQKYAEHHRKVGEASEFSDPGDPSFVPRLPKF